MVRIGAAITLPGVDPTVLQEWVKRLAEERDQGTTAVMALLNVFSDVHRGEGLTAVLLMLNVFLLLSSYYLLKTIREPLRRF